MYVLLMYCMCFSLALIHNTMYCMSFSLAFSFSLSSSLARLPVARLVLFLAPTRTLNMLRICILGVSLCICIGVCVCICICICVCVCVCVCVLVCSSSASGHPMDCELDHINIYIYIHIHVNMYMYFDCAAWFQASQLTEQIWRIGSYAHSTCMSIHAHGAYIFQQV